MRQLISPPFTLFKSSQNTQTITRNNCVSCDDSSGSESFVHHEWERHWSDRSYRRVGWERILFFVYSPRGLKVPRNTAGYYTGEAGSAVFQADRRGWTRGCLLMCTWFRRATVPRHRPTSPTTSAVHWYGPCRRTHPPVSIRHLRRCTRRFNRRRHGITWIRENFERNGANVNPSRSVTVRRAAITPRMRLSNNLNELKQTENIIIPIDKVLYGIRPAEG